VIKVEERDRNLISGAFLENNISAEYLWMRKYFTTETQSRFLIYFTIFRSHYYFVRHTGVYCTSRYLKKMKKMFSILENAHKKAKEDFDLDVLSEIEMGKYKI
jgi:hypothetical protein